MKRIKGLIFASILALFPLTAHAAGSANISASDTVVNGNNVTATVTLRNTAAWNVTISGSGSTNGCSVHEVGDSGNGNNTTKSFSVTCKATSLGTITFTYSGDITSADGSNTNINGSKKVTVVKPREKSTNNNLKSLAVDGYQITPEFNKDTLEYNVEVPDSVEKINISASLEDGYANLEGNGEKEVIEGLNKFEIKVTSETGAEKIYTLNVTVKDNNPTVEKIDGINYTLVKRASSLLLPEGVNKELFQEITVNIDELEIPAYTSEELNLTLIGLRDESGNIYLYRYQDGKIGTRYSVLASKAITVVIIDAKEELEGYTKTKLTINGKEYTVYQNDYKEYALIYGTNFETGESNWYLYNIKEESIQTYMKDMIANMTNNFNKELNEYKTIILGLCCLSILLLLVVIILIIIKGKRKKIIDTKNNEPIKKDNIETLDSLTVEEIKEEVKEDKKEIIVNKVEDVKPLEKKAESKKEKKKNKKKKEEADPKKDEFLTDEDLKEILDNKEIKLDIDSSKKEIKPELVQEEEEMDTFFLDEYKKRRKKKK